MAKLPIISKLFPSYRWKVTALIVCGVLVGGGGLFMYLLRAHTYLGDDPAACVNCHIMAPYYATWMHSSHSRDATCNDCHVPHENIVKKWAFKGMDGMKHVGAFLTKSEPQAIQAEAASAQVYIEYKNKTQEKCNYCTIYQCISVFYKKNVELHLLLILAIDSVIYSFYVTILLCKKAPVFD